ncbi:hypothetical protein HYX15_02715 [Candidatus Woesearchaeota archaeon]|nr:hypothetical protein [Candidatus Woesearchaeota archaeon]
MSKNTEEFNKNCGEILRLALAVESYLDLFISNYFCSPQDYKTYLFKDIMIIDSNLGFGRKVEVFKKICKEEDISEEELNKILASINFVNDIRNKVAHWEGYINNPKEGTIRLNKRKSTLFKKDELEVNSELVKEVDKKRLFSIQGITKIHMELFNPNRVRKTKIF